MFDLSGKTALVTGATSIATTVFHGQDLKEMATTGLQKRLENKSVAVG